MSYTSRDSLFDTLYEGEFQSPMNSEIPEVGGAVPEVIVNSRSPLDSSSDAGVAYVPRPPDPAVGGQPGMTHALGFTTGIRNSRAFRQPFHGQTLVVPSNLAHPIQGPVGYSGWADRRAAGVAALNGPDIPTDQSVSDQFANLNGAGLTGSVANPNYV